MDDSVAIPDCLTSARAREYYVNPARLDKTLYSASQGERPLDPFERPATIPLTKQRYDDILSKAMRIQELEQRGLSDGEIAMTLLREVLTPHR